MLTIAIISQKGGSGKTTLARSLAIAFERKGQATAIIDMDPQASAALWGKRRESGQPEIIPTVLPLLADVLKAARDSVEVIIIDTPPKSADVAIAAAKAADIIIIPCRPQIDDIETLPSTKQMLDVAGSKPTFVLLNSVPPNAARIQEATATISSHPDAPLSVCEHTFGHRAAFGDSSVIGQTPQEYEPSGKAAEEINKIHKYICEIVRKLRSENHGKTKHPRSGQA
jgi:chromosome partitioning protein